MSYSEDIAKVFGLEIGEDFTVLDEDDKPALFQPYHFTEEGLVNSSGHLSPTVIGWLVQGLYKIKKHPWKPNYSIKYYFVSIINNDVECDVWADTTADMAMYLMGNCFKTREEAMANMTAFKNHLETLEPDFSWRNDEAD